ncbi:heavy metal-associated isoprenylated plant protein 6-like [Senna tora]|uniref:Heavy metal-associated isoprenylated plant protein 6-like n=1 Tax=Senna tora TaxID=362788 RepID=A0A834W0M3_9FABA|nr:heavy metal-associated isoprenylated plant protein 6-like [Senna tora]
MGEQKEEPKNVAAEKKAPEGEAKKDEGPAPTVLKLDIHCEGCAKKIKRAVRHFEGVEDVKTDISANKVTVFGKVDPAMVRDKLAEKTKKKVELISPLPKKDAAADKKSDDKPEKKVEEKKPDDKKPDDAKPKESTVVLKIRLHCEGCIQKIRKIILKIKGVESVNIDGGKDLVTVKGTMDVKELTPYLKEKLKRNVEVVPPKKDDDKKEKDGGAGGEKKEKDGGGEKKEGGGDQKKEAEGAKPAAASGGGEGGKKEEAAAPVVAKVEVNKMEHYGYPAPTMWYNGHLPGGHEYSSYAMEVHPGYSNQGYYGNPGQGYVNHGYVNQGYPVEPPFYMQPHHPQMFSDENPNACSVM